jgi:uncharacterized iron-regulated protein
MKLNYLFTLLILFVSSFGLTQERAFRIYNSKGKKVSYKKMLKVLADKDIVLFGEIHDNPIAHWLQLELSKGLIDKRELVLGAEMIEADNQEVLDQYLKDEIDYYALDTLARLWPNYKTDYAPLVNFAKENDLSFVGTNIPRRYANMVYRGGFEVLDTLSAVEKSWMAPLPMEFDSELISYKNILEMMGDHGTPELVKAQASKDATMAYFIYKNYSPGKLFLHFNGSYHSDIYEGILWYLKRSNSTLKYGTISTVLQKNINKLEDEHKAKADFIICVDEDMTSTY